MRKIIKSDYLSRVEGEGGIYIEIKDSKIVKLQLNIFEAPRFFESFLVGRHYTDAPDFTARICGICPAAYLMSSVHAIEKIFGAAIDEPIRQLRRLLYASEWLSSHALHVYLLHGPDFYGIESAWADKNYIEIAKRGFAFKNLGNRITSVIGGRSVHPVSVRIGGFYMAPDKKDLTGFLPELEKALEDSLAGVKWASSLRFNVSETEMEYISLSHQHDYPMNEGKVLSNKGIDLSMERFLDFVQEYQVSYSTSLHSGIKMGKTLSPYLTGPVARVNLNHDKLPEEILEVIKQSGVKIPIKNLQMSIIARSIEISYAIYELLRIIKNYQKPEKPYTEFELRSGKAAWITEAPRGMLIHDYELDEKGFINKCIIIPPTSQNLFHIERSVYQFVQSNIGKPADYLKSECEKIIRSYDPCISCSTHVVML
jgi:coenzyme F420-reducing hydrogenase alpha subunit